MPFLEVSDYWHGWIVGFITGATLIILWLVLAILFLKDYGE